MRAFILLLLFSPVALFAQERIAPRALEVNAHNLKTDSLLGADADFTAASSAGKWSDESAVLLCQKTSFTFDKKGVSVGQRIGRNVLGLVFAPFTFGWS